VKKVYIKAVKYVTTCLVFVLDKTMSHLVSVSRNISNDIANSSLDFETRLEPVSNYLKPPTHKFGYLFSRTGMNKPIKIKRENGFTIFVPRVIFPKKQDQDTLEM